MNAGFQDYTLCDCASGLENMVSLHQKLKNRKDKSPSLYFFIRGLIHINFTCYVMPRAYTLGGTRTREPLFALNNPLVWLNIVEDLNNTNILKVKLMQYLKEILNYPKWQLKS